MVVSDSKKSRPLTDRAEKVGLEIQETIAEEIRKTLSIKFLFGVSLFPISFWIDLYRGEDL